jgi:hypothetical protein
VLKQKALVCAGLNEKDGGRMFYLVDTLRSR